MIHLAVALLLLSNTVQLTPQQKTEVKKVEESLLAPCCYSQSIARHMSEEAAQMRQEVAEMVATGKTEREIVEYYKGLYDDRILIVPDGRTGQVLFALPVVLFVACSCILLFFMRKMLRNKTDSFAEMAANEREPVSDPVRAKIERETAEGF